MIAKAILDMISLPTATPHAAAQSSGQPFQAFSDSLLAASKSFLQTSNTSDGGSKSGHRQKTDSDDAKTPDAALATDSAVGNLVVLPPVPQQSERTAASVTASESPLGGATATDETSTGVSGLFAQGLTAVEFAGTGLSIAQSGSSSTGIALSTGVQSRFSLAQMFLGKTATAQTTSMGSAVLSSSGVQATGVAKGQTSDAQMSVAQAKAAEASNAPTEIFQTADVQSKFIPAQVPVAGSVTSQNASTSHVSQPASNVTSADVPEIKTSVVPASVAQVSNVPADTVHAVSIQSNLTPVQTPLDGSAATQSASTSYVSQPAGVQSKFIQEQTPITEPASKQNTSNAVASQPARNVTVAEIPETQTNSVQASVAPASAAQVNDAPASKARTIIAPVEILKPTAVQAEIASTLAQAPAQSTVTGDSQPARNVIATEPVVSKSSISHAEVSQTDASRKTTVELASVQSNVTSASNELSQSFSKFVVAPVQEMTAPIAASAKSGNADQSAVPETTVAQDNGSVQDSLPAAAQNTTSNTVQDAVANDPIEPSRVPVLPAALIASAKEVSAQALKADSIVQADPQPAVSDQTPAAEMMSVPGVIADQLAASPLSGGPFGVHQIGVSSLKPAAAMKPQAADSKNDKDSGTERTELKKDAEPASEKETKSSSQDTASSGDQSQGGNANQTQATVPVPVNFTVHPAAVIVAAQNVAHVAANHTSSTSADAAGVGVKTVDTASVHASAALPQALPVINTAKLIQSMGQSEMRVGMRSNEFGNISISTSTTHDQVSAQISLEHGELAKTLAAQLPEMQARLGGNHPMDVRIDMNGTATGQGTNAFGGTSHGSQDQSSNGRQQAGNMAASSPIIGSAEKQFSPVAVAMPTGYARLDIRV